MGKGLVNEWRSHWFCFPHGLGSSQCVCRGRWSCCLQIQTRLLGYKDGLLRGLWWRTSQISKDKALNPGQTYGPCERTVAFPGLCFLLEDVSNFPSPPSSSFCFSCWSSICFYSRLFCMPVTPPLIKHCLALELTLALMEHESFCFIFQLVPSGRDHTLVHCCILGSWHIVVLDNYLFWILLSAHHHL